MQPGSIFMLLFIFTRHEATRWNAAHYNAHAECLGFGFALTRANDCFTERRIMIAYRREIMAIDSVRAVARTSGAPWGKLNSLRPPELSIYEGQQDCRCEGIRQNIEDIG